MTIRLEQALRALQAMQHFNIDVSQFIIFILTSTTPEIRDSQLSLIQHATAIFDAFSTVPEARNDVVSWVHTVAKNTYMEEFCALTSPGLRFHFNARKATMDKIENFKMDILQSHMLSLAPHLYDLIGDLLVSDPKLEVHRVEIPSAGENEEEEPGDEDEEEPERVPIDEEADLWSEFGELHPEDFLDDEAVAEAMSSLEDASSRQLKKTRRDGRVPENQTRHARLTLCASPLRRDARAKFRSLNIYCLNGWSPRLCSVAHFLSKVASDHAVRDWEGVCQNLPLTDSSLSKLLQVLFLTSFSG
ncbi:hypothetical protein M422DRAFT_773749 [Sphaerobolus stellatus SS14]|nr:hypothetical protein M422DRAFT_773749 [Sphaerobolus stellatus SS14]